MLLPWSSSFNRIVCLSMCVFVCLYICVSVCYHCYQVVDGFSWNLKEGFNLIQGITDFGVISQCRGSPPPHLFLLPIMCWCAVKKLLTHSLTLPWALMGLLKISVWQRCSFAALKQVVLERKNCCDLQFTLKHVCRLVISNCVSLWDILCWN